MPRMFLNLYETTYMEHALACTAAGQRPFPALVLFMTSISHVSLAINRCVPSVKRDQLISQYRMWHRKWRETKQQLI